MMTTTIADLPARLEGFLAEKAGAPARVTGLRNLTGGASRDTWAIDAEVGGAPLALILRRDMGGEIDSLALSREQEFRVLEVAHAGGVMVPRPRWACPSPEVLGAPFFLMDRLTGESVGRRIVREPGLATARQRLPRQMGEQLARIHALDARNLDFLPHPESGSTPALTTLGHLRRQMDELGEPHPVLELALRWLERNAPPRSEVVLLHGDFRIGNLMVGPEGLVGVFDWEFCHLGDPHEDLAWPCVRSWRFGVDGLRLGGVGQPDDYFAAYEGASGRKVDMRAIHYWEVMGNLRWGVGCIAQAHRHLSGQAPSVELASLGRRTAEMEWELLELLERDGPSTLETAPSAGGPQP